MIIPEYRLSNHITLGVLWGTLSGLTFALLSVLNRKYVRQYSALTIAFYQNTFACICLWPVIFSIHISFPFHELLNLLILGILCTALSHTLFIQSMIRLKAQLASVIAGLEPVYGMALAALLLGEYPNLRTLAGGGVILTTVIFAAVKMPR